LLSTVVEFFHKGVTVRVSARIALATTLLSAAACQSADKRVSDTAAQSAALGDSVAAMATPTAAPNVSVTPVSSTPAVVTANTQATRRTPVKSSSAPTNADAQAARADSARQAQARAEAQQAASADSVKRAEAARAIVKTEPPAAPPATASTVAVAQAADGKVPYEENCRKCHGVRGVPPKTMKEKFPKIATFDAAFFAKHSADSIVTVLANGKNDDMKSFKDKLTHSEMVAVTAYIRIFVH